MVAVTNPVNAQNIVDRFADYVVATANAGITWGNNAIPFAEWNTVGYGVYWGGSTSGKGIGISGANVGAGGAITASTIYNALVSETNAYSSIRLLRALLFIQGSGGNNGTYGTAGYIYDATAVAYLNPAYYGQSVGAPANNGVVAGQPISYTGLEGFYDILRSSYNTVRGNIATIEVSVCHASCHNSCHSSRSRR